MDDLGLLEVEAVRGHPRTQQKPVEWPDVEQLCKADRVEPYKPMKRLRDPRPRPG